MSAKSVLNGQLVEHLFSKRFLDAQQVSFFYADFVLDERLIEVKKAFKSSTNTYYIKFVKTQLEEMLQRNVLLAVYISHLNDFFFYELHSTMIKRCYNIDKRMRNKQHTTIHFKVCG